MSSDEQLPKLQNSQNEPNNSNAGNKLNGPGELGPPTVKDVPNFRELPDDQKAANVRDVPNVPDLPKTQKSASSSSSATTSASSLNEQSSANEGLTIRVPASAANIGPGLETIAIAFKRYLTVNVQVQAPRAGQGPEIITIGNIAKQLPTDGTNHIARVFDQVFSQDKRVLSCLKFTIETDIPIASGLGSSAAATVAGVTAALALGRIQLEKGRIFAETAKIEGNAASPGAAIFGGFMLCAPNIVPGDILARKLIWPEKWCVIGIIPPYTIPAKKTRSALPASVSHKDAIYNVQKMALLIEAVAAGDDESMKAALRDKLHEPFRAKLVPEFSELRKLLQNYDVLGTVISGNGPTMLTFVDIQQKLAVLEALNHWAQSQKNGCRIEEFEIDDEGLFVRD